MRKINPDTEGINITSEGLEISKANYADSGMYTAKLTNGLKEAESSCKLLVMAYVNEGISSPKEEKQVRFADGDFIPTVENQDVTIQCRSKPLYLQVLLLHLYNTIAQNNSVSLCMVQTLIIHSK